MIFSENIYTVVLSIEDANEEQNSFYWGNRITKKVYNNIINPIKL